MISELERPPESWSKVHTARKKLMGSPIIKDNSHVKRKLHLEHHIGDDDFSVPHLEIWSRILSLEHSKPLDFLSHFALIHRLNLLAQVSKATGSLADQIGLKDSGTHSSCANVSFNDCAHIPWEDSTNFPKPPKRKNSFINLWWNIRGTFQGYVGEILESWISMKSPCSAVLILEKYNNKYIYIYQE